MFIKSAIGMVLAGLLLVPLGLAETPPTEQSSILVTISPDKAIVMVGDTVHCAFTVQNTGDLTVSSLTLRDDDRGINISLSKSELAKGESATGAYDYQVTEADLPGPFLIQVTAAGVDKYGRSVKANAYTNMPLASLKLTKTASVQAAPPGDSVTYTFTVENTGSIAIDLARIEDDRLGTLNLSGTSLAPGDSLTVKSLPYTLPDDPSGKVINTATVYGSATSSGETAELQATDSAEVKLVHVRLEKAVTPEEAYVGQTVVFTITVHNDDPFERTLHLADELLDIDMDITLPPNGDWSQDFEYVIPYEAGDELVNIAVLSRPGEWEMEAQAKVKVLRPDVPGPFDPDDPRNQPWDVSLAVVKVFDTQVFDGSRCTLKILNSAYEPVSEIPLSGSLYVEVTDPDQNERPLLKEMIFGGWNKDSVAGETALPGNAAGTTCADPKPSREEDSAPIWDLAGSEGAPTPTTSDLMTPDGAQVPTGINLALRSISGIPATVKIIIWDAQTGYWERLDLKETAPDSGVFRSTTCVAVADSRHPGEGNLGASPEDTIFALYQDPSNHSDIALAMIKVSGGGAGEVQPPTAGLGLAFDRPSYQPGDRAVLTLTDPAYAGQPSISSTTKPVLVLTDASGTVINEWDSLPASDQEKGIFQVSFTIPSDVSLGTLHATYTDPSFPERTAEATAQLTSATLQGVSGVVPQPKVLATSVEFAVITRPEGLPVGKLTVTVYDLLGKEVAELSGEDVTSLSWDGGSLRNGAYIYVAQVEDPTLAAPQVFRGFVYIHR